MSSYCECCPNNIEHIARHYDPSNLTTPDESAEEVLDTFRACFPNEPCPLTIEDVSAYIASRTTEGTDDDRTATR